MKVVEIVVPLIYAIETVVMEGWWRNQGVSPVSPVERSCFLVWQCSSGHTKLIKLITIGESICISQIGATAVTGSSVSAESQSLSWTAIIQIWYERSDKLESMDASCWTAQKIFAISTVSRRAAKKHQFSGLTKCEICSQSISI